MLREGGGAWQLALANVPRMSGAAETHGEVAPGYEAVGETFAQLFGDGVESGASAAAIHDGRMVVDLWGGSAGRDSLVHVYSVSKPFAAACALWLVDRGVLGLDTRVAELWPEYAQGGKHDTTLRHLLTHQAGLLAWRAPQPLEALIDHRRAAELLAAEPAWWPPGTAHGEHALFYGTLLGELVRRADGRSLGALFRDEFARPWRLDVHIGLAPADEARVAMLADPEGLWPATLLDGRDEAYRLALDNPPALAHLDVVNSHAWRQAEVPAVNAHATARGIARFYAGLLGAGELEGIRVLGERTVAAMTAPQSAGPDRLLGQHVTWGLGVGLEEGGWGMGGIGGSLGWALPARRLAWGYATTRIGDHDRALALEASLLAAIDSL
jgi:CubicO group peptidase (beta-lactamase class C family)